jgi:DNA-binding beta-propeller fold protein YncE
MRFWMLAAALLAVGCSSGTEKPGTLCPTLNDQGPAMERTRAYLVVANSLGEDWLAAPLTAADLAPLSERGLTGRAPNDLDVVGDFLYMVNSGDNTISVVDMGSGLTVGCIGTGTGSNPWEFAVDPANPSRAWVTCFTSGELLEIDLDRRRVARRVTIGSGLEGLWVGLTEVAASLTGFEGTIGAFGNGTVVVLTKSTLAERARLAVPPNPQTIFTGADARLHVVCTGNFSDVTGRVVRVEADYSAVRDTLVLGGSPQRVALALDGTAYLAGFYGGILAYDTANFIALRTTANPLLPESGYSAVAIEQGRLYAANFDLDAVVVVDLASGTIVDDFLAGDGPIALALVPIRALD